jgi:hypothetical protein
MASLKPALVQVLISVLQTVAAAIFVRCLEPMLCKLVNCQIDSLQAKLNERVNNRVEGAVDKVFGQAFSAVREKADNFFPKFVGCLDKLKDAMKQAAKLDAMAGKVGF